MNCVPELAGKYLYREFPQYFTWIQSQKEWVPRRIQNQVVGRIYVVSPSEGERFYLRILLNNVSGSKSFEYLITVNGNVYTTFKEAAEIRGLLQHDDYVHHYHPLPRIIEDELSIQISDDDLRSIEYLNAQQKMTFDSVIQNIMCNQPKLFFIDGPGGTGKAFLYRTILAHVRKSGKTIIAVATSGITATLLPGGRTAHSRLQISLKPTTSTLCTIKKQTDLAELIRRATTVIWDEAPMANCYAFESVNKNFQDIMENHLPFGGKIMVFGGDFRQVLQVVKLGTMREQIAASILKSTFWHRVNVLHLQQNMRSADDTEFSEFLLRIGNGLQHTINGDFIKFPDSLVIRWENEESIDKLIDFVFPNMINHVNDANYMVGRAIITPKNCDVDKINEMFISKFPGEEKVYTSWDSIEDDNNNIFQEEFLNSLSPSGFPPYRISLKVGCPIMLLRNVSPELGLCNGTRLICRTFGRNFIDAEIITGPHKGTRYFLHRIPLKSEENSGLPFELTGDQIHFPGTLVADEKTVIENIKDIDTTTCQHTPPAQSYRVKFNFNIAKFKDDYDAFNFINIVASKISSD
ncbi:ATP-dependent DNA helicase pfh1-like [Henckelia pumila]|uniref:ATP-dependent DNA helicase pfh1-like n=1 Tax=Henckelia pumila TaxID=405737 RepID=UPI003C6E99BA